MAKEIGVCNFHIPHLEKIIKETGVTPYINQVELHPFFQQNELKAFHKKNNIITEAWSPLGQGQVLTDPVIAEIAKKHNKSTAQIILRWHMELGHVAIPKSITPSRIKENFNIFDFKLSSDEMQMMAGLDSKEGRIGPNPETADF